MNIYMSLVSHFKTNLSNIYMYNTVASVKLEVFVYLC